MKNPNKFLSKGISTPIGIVIIVLVALLAGGVLAWQYFGESEREIEEGTTIDSGTEGSQVPQATAPTEGEASPSEEGEIKKGECVDSDNGKDYYTKGSITGFIEATGEVKTIEEYCWHSYGLMEYYCQGRYIKLDSFECPYGCKDGVCLKEEKFIRIISPNEGEQLVEGTETPIKWTMKGLEGQQVYIWLEAYNQSKNTISALPGYAPPESSTYLIGIISSETKELSILSSEEYGWVWEIPNDLYEGFEQAPVYYKIWLTCSAETAAGAIEVKDKSDEYLLAPQ